MADQPPNNNAQIDPVDPRSLKSPKQRKIEYLSKLVKKLAGDATAKQIFRDYPNEFERDCKLIDYLLVRSKQQYDFNIVYKEIYMAMLQEYVRYSKSQSKAALFKTNGEAEANKNRPDYGEAIRYLGSAIRYETDNNKLAELFCLRGDYFYKLKNYDNAVINYEMAKICKPDSVDSCDGESKNDIKNRKDKINQIVEKKTKEYPRKRSDNLWFEADMDYKPFIHENICVAERYDKAHDSVHSVLVVNKEIPNQTNLIRVRPHCFYSQLLLDFCHGCRRELQYECYWPCKRCASVVYCSLSCLESTYNLHEIECRFTKYVQTMPWFAILLRSYWHDRDNCCITGDYDPTQNWAQSALKQMGPSIEDAQARLNGLRQLSDQRRTIWQEQDQYYALLINSIEFLCLYQHLRMSDIFDNSLANEPQHRETFSWAAEMASTPVFLIAKIFADVRRFVSLRSIKFVNSWAGPEEYKNREENRFVFVAAEMMGPEEKLLTNVSATIDIDGQIILNSIRLIKSGEQLRMAKEKWFASKEEQEQEQQAQQQGQQQNQQGQPQGQQPQQQGQQQNQRGQQQGQQPQQQGQQPQQQGQQPQQQGQQQNQQGQPQGQQPQQQGQQQGQQRRSQQPPAPNQQLRMPQQQQPAPVPAANNFRQPVNQQQQQRGRGRGRGWGR